MLVKSLKITVGAPSKIIHPNTKNRKAHKFKLSGVLHSVPVGAKLTSTGRHAPLPRNRCDRI